MKKKTAGILAVISLAAVFNGCTTEYNIIPTYVPVEGKSLYTKNDMTEADYCVERGIKKQFSETLSDKKPHHLTLTDKDLADIKDICIKENGVLNKYDGIADVNFSSYKDPLIKGRSRLLKGINF